MQRSLQYYWNIASSGVALVRAIAPQVQELSPLCLEMDQESAPGVDLEKHPNRQQRIINVLFTKRSSIIAPKLHDNYLIHSISGTFAI